MPTKDTQVPSEEKTFSLISDEKLLDLYAALLKCRALSRRAFGSRKQTQVSIAAAVAVAIDLILGDTLSATGQDAVARFAKGSSLKATLAALTSPRQRSIAAVIKSAMRSARAHKAKRSKKAAVVLCSDPSEAHELWQDSLREAASKRLPILFVCCADAEDEVIAPAAPDFRLASIVVDGNDLVAIYRVATEALAHARRGNGPTLILCQPWRPAKPSLIHANDSDPILNMETYLARKGLLTAEFKKITLSEFARQLREAFTSNVT
jgi:pyruvate dehydrogenase E1 component alpha subunit